MASSTTQIRGRIAAVQKRLTEVNADALLVMAGDPHVSEYPCSHWEGRRWLSGFTGSMATLIIFRGHAVLLPESIYFDQADQQLQDTGIEVVKTPLGSVAGLIEWLPSQLHAGTTVLVDGRALAVATAAQLGAKLAQHKIQLLRDLDILGEVWIDRPPVPNTPVFEHPIRYAATPRSEKLRTLQALMKTLGATHHLISSLEDIAWLTNLRGGDSPNTPVFMAHMLISETRAQLFLDERKLNPELRQTLARDGIEVGPYDGIHNALAALGQGNFLLIDPKRCSIGVRDSVGVECQVVEAINPTVLAKACKTNGEAAAIREAMTEDGVAMCEFYAWFESQIGREPITEMKVDEVLTAARQRRPGFIMRSFPTIAGFNAHGALPHYVATPESDLLIEGQGVLLIDSGAQYMGATTDITRVWPIGPISQELKRDVTLVLKANIALSRAHFPVGTLSTMLDAIARAPMWAEGLDYAHGTGHGVGMCLGVHEGPQTFRQAIPDPSMAMHAGMVTSIEPALYRPGRWGVRLENLVLAVSVPRKDTVTTKDFLAFEVLTMCPIDTRCLDVSMLRDDEREWLNVYHEQVRNRLSPHLKDAALEWLIARTQAV